MFMATCGNQMATLKSLPDNFLCYFGIAFFIIFLHSLWDPLFFTWLVIAFNANHKIFTVIFTLFIVHCEF